MSSQPTHFESQPVATNHGDLPFADYEQMFSNKRIKELAQKYEENLKNRDVDDIGFNLFELISDHYYRETFHSDIINALLDPEGKHQEGQKYLDLFLKYLRSQHGVNIDLEHYSGAEVEKEEGRIDILIKGRKHAIIIENKINGAIDQPTQLPDYLKKVEDKGFINCDAIIYLRLNGNTRPDTTGWKKHPQGAEVDKKLKIICAYDGTDDGTKKDLLKGWILKCGDESKENPNAQHIIRQYGDIIKKLGRNVMNEPIMEEFYKVMVACKGENFKTALSLKKMLEELVLYRVKKILDKFPTKDDCNPFERIHKASNIDAKFEYFHWNKAKFALDIIVNPESYSFQFWDTEDRDGTKYGLAKEILHKIGCLNEYPSKVGPDAGVFCREFPFPSQDEEDIIEYIRDFKKKLGDIPSGD